MNERNKKLANIWANRRAEDPKLGITYTFSEKALDVFAEEVRAEHTQSVIQECCIALNPMLRDMISRRQGVDLIKLQFGMNPKEITTAMLDASIAQCEQELAKKKSGVE